MYAWGAEGMILATTSHRNRRMPPSSFNFSSAESSNREQVGSLSPFHAVIISLIAGFGGYLQFYNKSRNRSLSDEHGNIMLAIYVFLSLYAVAVMAEIKLQTQLTYLPIIKRYSPLIGILVVVLLLKILFPLLGVAAFIVWAMFMVEAITRSLQETFQRYCYIYSYVQRILGSNFDIEENPSLGNEENDSTVTVSEDTGLPV